jgi:DnaK suppressor protein
LYRSRRLEASCLADSRGPWDNHCPVNPNDFKAQIESRISELEDLAESSQAATATVELDQTRQGRLSRMDALQGQAMAKDAERRRQLELQRLQAALARIERDEFGFCLDCDEPIAVPRLNADPASTLCLACASARER